MDGEDQEIIGDWPGATPDGYMYAPESDGEIRQAVALLIRTNRLLQAARAREWTRCGNDRYGGGTLEELLKHRRELEERRP